MTSRILRIVILAILPVAGFGAGFVAGIYALPILIEARSGSPAPALPPITAGSRTGRFIRGLPGSDPLHWGEGSLRMTETELVFGEDVTLAPGPDYRVYLTRRFVDNKPDFLRIKAEAVEIGRVQKFSGPLVFSVPEGLDTDAYDNALVWCEAFSMFITSARLD